MRFPAFSALPSSVSNCIVKDSIALAFWLDEMANAPSAAAPAAPMPASAVVTLPATVPMLPSDVLTPLSVLSKCDALPLMSTVNAIIYLPFLNLCQFALAR